MDWVRVFRDDLVKDINRFADLDVFPFLDKTRLQPGYIWNERLVAAARLGHFRARAVTAFLLERLLPEGIKGIYRGQRSCLRIGPSQPYSAGEAAVF
jgi:hypothetical protein